MTADRWPAPIAHAHRLVQPFEIIGALPAGAWPTAAVRLSRAGGALASSAAGLVEVTVAATAIATRHQ